MKTARLPWVQLLGRGDGVAEEYAELLRLRVETVRRWKDQGVPRGWGRRLAESQTLDPENVWPEEWAGEPTRPFVRSWPTRTWAGTITLRVDVLPTIDAGGAGIGRVTGVSWECHDTLGGELSTGSMILPISTIQLKVVGQLLSMLAQDGPHALDNLGSDPSDSTAADLLNRAILKDPDAIARMRRNAIEIGEMVADERLRLVADARSTLALLAAGLLAAES
jgi:hypothetical protein